MAGAGYKLFTAGAVLTAAQMNTFVNEQTVMVFATSAARDAALTSVKAEGNLTYQLDANSLTVYSGAAWSTIGPIHGALTSFTPTITQGVGVTFTINTSTYQRIGRMVLFQGLYAITSAGTPANAVVITLPVTGLAAGNMWTGTGLIQDVSASTQFPGSLVNASTTTYNIGSNSTGGAINAVYGSTGFVAGLASGDVIKVSGFYEAAADA